MKSCKIYSILNRAKISSNFKNGIIFTFFSFLNNGVSFLLIMILASYLLPNSYGLLNLYSTLIAIITIIMPLGISGYISVSFFNRDVDNFRAIIRLYCSVIVTILLIIIVFGLLFSTFLNNYIGLPIEFIIIALVVCGFQLMTNLNLDIWRLEEKPISYGIYSLIIVILNFLISILFVALFEMDWEGRVYAQLLVSVCFGVFSMCFLVKREYLRVGSIPLNVIKETFKFSLPLIPHQVSSWLRQGLDRYIINFFWCGTVVGVFSFAFNLSNIIHMIGVAFNASNSVYIYKKLSDKNTDVNLLKAQIKKQTFFMSAFFIFMFFVIYILSCLCIPYLFPNYNDSIPYLLPLCLAATLQCIYYLFVNFLFFYKKTKVLMYITLTCSIIHLSLSVFLTKYNSLYTAYIAMFSNLLICILVILYARKFLGKRISR